MISIEPYISSFFVSHIQKRTVKFIADNDVADHNLSSGSGLKLCAVNDEPVEGAHHYQYD